MKMKLIFVISVVILVLLTVLLLNPCNKLSVISNSVDTRENKVEDALLVMLFPYIHKAIEQYYGKNRQFMEPTVIDIKRLESAQYHFKIKVQVITFEGPHNPPYGLETMTIIHDYSGVHVANFKHEKWGSTDSNRN